MRGLVKAAGATAVAAALGIVVERTMVAAPHYHGPISDHFDGRRFHNLASGWQSGGSFLKWQLTKKPGAWPDWIDSQPGPAPPDRVDGGPKRHRAPGLRFSDLPPIDAVLVSHNHYDHLDAATLRRLNHRAGRARIFTPLGNAALMARHDVGGATDLDWWQSATLSDRVTVTLVPAQHFCARALSDRNATLWGGFVITGPSGSAYFAGDTGWGQHFAQVAERFGPMRVAMLPIGAYLPRWFMKPAHISPAEAVHEILQFVVVMRCRVAAKRESL